jgi:hypothetical protein
MAREGVHEWYVTKDLKADSRNLFYRYYPGILLERQREIKENLGQKSRLQTNTM